MTLVNASRQCHDPQAPFGQSVQSILSRMLHDAQFWELLRLRGRFAMSTSYRSQKFSLISGVVEAFIAKLIEQTAPLKEFDVSNLLSHLTANAPRPTVDAVARIASTYGILLITPPEYLARATHIEFLKRGFAADVVVYLTLRYAQNNQLSKDDLLTIREVLRRTAVHLGMIENVVRSDNVDRCRVADVSCRSRRSF